MISTELSTVHCCAEGCFETKGLRKCGRCDCVEYCGEDSQTNSWRKVHKNECAKLAEIRTSLMGAFKAVSCHERSKTENSNGLERVSVEFLDKSFGRVVITKENFKPGDVCFTERPLLVCRNRPFPSAFFAAFMHADADTQAKIFDMDAGPTTSPGLDEKNSVLKQYEEFASLLVKIPEWHQRFSPDPIKILHLISIYLCNAHSYRKGSIESKGGCRVKEEHEFEFSALFEIGSKVEHSCSPNMWYCSAGGILKYIAARQIPKGERLSFSYIGDKVENPMRMRLAELWKTKFFHCRCTRCTGREMCRPLFCECTGVTLCQLSEPTPSMVQEIWLCLSCNKKHTNDKMRSQFQNELNLYHECQRFRNTQVRPGHVKKMKQLKLRLASSLPQLHYLHFICLELIAKAAASEARMCRDAPTHLQRNFPDWKVNYLLSAKSLRELIGLREQLQALYWGELEPADVWQRSKAKLPKISNVSRCFGDTIADVYLAGMDYFQAGDKAQAAYLFSEYYCGLLLWLDPRDPHVEIIKQLVSEHGLQPSLS